MDDPKAILRKLKPFVGKKADAIWMRYTTGDRTEKEEWLQVINLLAEKYGINPVEERITLLPMSTF